MLFLTIVTIVELWNSHLVGVEFVVVVAVVVELLGDLVQLHIMQTMNQVNWLVLHRWD